jgi:hypothetical protein
LPNARVKGGVAAYFKCFPTLPFVAGEAGIPTMQRTVKVLGKEGELALGKIIFKPLSPCFCPSLLLTRWIRMSGCSTASRSLGGRRQRERIVVLVFVVILVVFVAALTRS